MNRFVWAGGGALAALVVLAGSMVHVVPPDTPPAPAPIADAKPESPPVTPREHPRLTVPVAGIDRARLSDTWGQSRAGGLRGHQAIDIMAPGGAPVLAAAPGTVEKLYFSDGGGGIALYIRSPDRLWCYYYAHLQGYAPGLHEGQVVGAGELIGYVGDTGNAGAGNFHLHFGLSRMKPEERWHQGEPINPYPLLAGPGAPR